MELARKDWEGDWTEAAPLDAPHDDQPFWRATGFLDPPSSDVKPVAHGLQNEIEGLHHVLRVVASGAVRLDMGETVHLKHTVGVREGREGPVLCGVGFEAFVEGRIVEDGTIPVVLHAVGRGLAESDRRGLVRGRVAHLAVAGRRFSHHVTEPGGSGGQAVEPDGRRRRTTWATPGEWPGLGGTPRPAIRRPVEWRLRGGLREWRLRGGRPAG